MGWCRGAMKGCREEGPGEGGEGGGTSETSPVTTPTPTYRRTYQDLKLGLAVVSVEPPVVSLESLNLRSRRELSAPG